MRDLDTTMAAADLAIVAAHLRDLKRLMRTLNAGTADERGQALDAHALDAAIAHKGAVGEAVARVAGVASAARDAVLGEAPLAFRE